MGSYTYISSMFFQFSKAVCNWINFHRCEVGGALTPSKNDSRGILLCFAFMLRLGQESTVSYGCVAKIWLSGPMTSRANVSRYF